MVMLKKYAYNLLSVSKSAELSAHLLLVGQGGEAEEFTSFSSI